jgi:glucokinase
MANVRYRMRQYPEAMNSDTAIGIDVGGTNTKGAVVRPDGGIVERVELPTDPTSGTKGILRVAEDLLRRAADASAEVTCIGVGAAGFIHSPTGSVTFAPNLTYDDPQIAVAVHSRTDLPVIVDNDANAAAWGERAFGAARGCDDMVLLTLGTGIGSGFVVDGRLVRGHTGAGAEFGHVVIDPDGPPCKCGLRGCLEQLASGEAIEKMAKKAVAEHPDSSILSFAGALEQIEGQHVAKAARERDEVALEVLRTAGVYLGIGLSNLVNLFDPQTIVLGGSVVHAGEAYLGPARDQLFAMTTAQRRRPVRLDVTSLGNDAGILGAAALAFDEAKIPG